jgi:hypothetical protein
MTISHLHHHHLRQLTTHLREEGKDYSSSDADDADSSEDESIEEVAEEEIYGWVIRADKEERRKVLLLLLSTGVHLVPILIDLE